MARKEFSKATMRQALTRSSMKCEVAKCEKDIFRRDLCAMHYSRLLRNGSVDAALRRTIANNDGLEWIKSHKDWRGDDCLIFPYTTEKSGYGRVTFNGKRMGAHRAMCIIVHGDPQTQGHEAAHNCGNGHLSCVNPKHLRWATHAENLHDREKHNTDNKGQRHGLSKLTVSNVLEIRRRSALGVSQSKIAENFEIQQSTVSKIVRRERWGWLKDA